MSRADFAGTYTARPEGAVQQDHPVTKPVVQIRTLNPKGFAIFCRNYVVGKHFVRCRDRRLGFPSKAKNSGTIFTSPVAEDNFVHSPHDERQRAARV